MAMSWSDVDLEGAVWRIPAAVAKNKQVAAVPLVPPALEILRRRLAFRDNSPWVFPATSKTGHIAHAAKAWSSLIKAIGLSALRPHDLRRTIGSWLAAAGASSFVIQKALTHQSAASAEAYTRVTRQLSRSSIFQGHLEGSGTGVVACAPREQGLKPSTLRPGGERQSDPMSANGMVRPCSCPASK